MKSNLILVGAGALIILGAWYASTQYGAIPEPAPSLPVSNADETEVRRVVTEFGAQMQKVSLLAPTNERKAAMDAAYDAYVAAELLEKWYPEGAEALGRYSSSPWPERIEIVEIRPVGGNFLVEGTVIEVTSVEAGTMKSAAAVYPVSFALEKRDGSWKIVKAEKGAYSEIPRRQTIVGYWECLPHKDRTGPQTMECTFGIAVDRSDGHFAVDTRLMSTSPIDFPAGTKVRVSGVVTPANQLSSVQKYDIDGVISATEIERI